MSFEFLDHTADIIIRATGKDLKEAFEQAAMGYFTVLTDPAVIHEKITKEITVTSENLEALLYDWIDQFIFLFDTEYFVAHRVEILDLQKQADGKYLLFARAYGEEFDPSSHPQKTEVKAMTYSFMKVGENFVEFTLDL
ncbi:MAG: archease [Candidatus Heimdallarchaeota archaeon]